MLTNDGVFTMFDRRFAVKYSTDIGCDQCVLGPALPGSAEAFICTQTPCSGLDSNNAPFVLSEELTT